MYFKFLVSNNFEKFKTTIFLSYVMRPHKNLTLKELSFRETTNQEHISNEVLKF